MSQNHRRSAHDLTLGFGLASIHAAVTMWYRMPMIAAGCFAPTRETDSEMARMVHEKAAAMFEGAIDAQIELARFAGAAATGKLDLAQFAAAPAAIASAGMQPAFRRVRSNSQRLHRQRFGA